MNHSVLIVLVRKILYTINTLTEPSPQLYEITVKKYIYHRTVVIMYQSSHKWLECHENIFYLTYRSRLLLVTEKGLEQLS